MLQTKPFKDLKVTRNTKKAVLKDLIKKGIPSSQIRASIWSVTTGWLQKQVNANANSDIGNHYAHLLDSVQKSAIDPLVAIDIEKDVSRTFPGHVTLDTKAGQDKLQRVLTAFSKRNEEIGYCQSMNFLVGIGLLVTQSEEEAFWLLTSIVEDHCPGQYSRTMISIQVDTLVLTDLVDEKLPDLSKHFQKQGFDLLIVATKWFMCLFVGILPTESMLRIWDHFFFYGSRVLFRTAIAILNMCKEDLLQSTDTMDCWYIILERCQSLIDPKKLLKSINKFKDITTDKIEDLRAKHQAQVKPKVYPVVEGRQEIAAKELQKNGFSISGKLDSIVNLLRRSSRANPFDVVPRYESNVLETMTHPIDFVVQGLGVRYYLDGKKYQGGFMYGKREGKGTLYDKNGTIAYEGQWKADKREGEGTSTDSAGNTYTGLFKNDKYHGKGILRMKEKKVEYTGDWMNGNQEGKGTFIFANGDRYDGECKNNKRHGSGVYNYQGGARYDGEWVNDKQEGKGIMTFPNGDKYEGEWKNGKREGKGKMVYSNKDTYEGEWKEDKMHGKGVYTMQGNSFEGQFKGGFRIDGGIKRWPDGTLYEDPPELEKRGRALSWEAPPNLNLSENWRSTPITTDSMAMSPPSDSMFTKAMDTIRRKNSLVNS